MVRPWGVVVMLRPLRKLEPLTEFRWGDSWRELRDPDDHPTAKQLLKLNGLGCLAVVEPGQVQPLSKGEAAAALAFLLTGEATEPAIARGDRQPAARGFA